MINFLKNWQYNLNYYFMQFLFMRIIGIADDYGKILGFGVMIGVVPFTGWNTDYKFIFKKIISWRRK